MAWPIGSKVRIVAHNAFSTSGNGKYMGDTAIGEEGYVTAYCAGNDYHTIWSGMPDNGEYYGMFTTEELERVDDSEGQADKHLIHKENSNMAETINVVAAIRDSDLTSNQRLLREQGLVNTCGEITVAGQNAIWALLVRDKEDELVAVIKAAQKAEEAAKPKK